jgi:glycine cleavage system aminomethyltransferase T
MKENAEHETVRNAVGVLMFHTWGFFISGPNALALIQKVTLMMPQH